MVAPTQQKQPEAPVEAKTESHQPPQMARSRVLVYLLRRDLRVSDNPILHHLATATHDFTHVLPVYVFSPHQIEVSGFLEAGAQNPYPEARGRVGKYWRCGPHRAAFIAQSVWDLKESLQKVGSDVLIRVGKSTEVVQDLARVLKEKDQEFGALWMVSHEGTEEHAEEKTLASLCKAEGADFKLWVDEKYFIDDRDVGLSNPDGVPDVFTTYRKSVEPLKEKPRASVPAPQPGLLPALPDISVIADQKAPFVIPETMADLVAAVVTPVKDPAPFPFPEKAVSAHPFRGGESFGHTRLSHMIKNGGMKRYKDTRNEMVGVDFSTKLSAYLALGCLTARQVHHTLVSYEDGTNEAYKDAPGFGEGENEGTKAVRFELLWRDYMRLCHQKYGHRMFRLEGFKGDQNAYSKWKTPDKDRAAPDQDPTPERVAHLLERFKAGTTGMGLIDASQRELMHTGYTSNRARQNVASFLSKHLGIDWRYGAEWYEMLLVDYDVSSNWANWQYVSGVGNDPRGELRIFNPIKQAFDYDKEGTYVRSWVPELAGLAKLENLFQVCTTSADDLKAAGLENNVMVTDPVKRIEFSVAGRPHKPGRRPFFRRGNRSGRGSESASGNDAKSSTTAAAEPGGQPTTAPSAAGTEGGAPGGSAPGQMSPRGTGQHRGFRGRPHGRGRGGMGMTRGNSSGPVGNGNGGGHGDQGHRHGMQQAPPASYPRGGWNGSGRGARGVARGGGRGGGRGAPAA